MDPVGPRVALPAAAVCRPRLPAVARPLRSDLAPPLALALAGAALYLLLSPPAGDLGAAYYRSALFGRHPFGLFDLRWYAGHYLPAYSLFAPALGWLLGVRLALALCAPLATAAFTVLVRGAWSERRAVLTASLAFAFGFCAELCSGRLPFDLGFAFGLCAAAALWGNRRRPAAAVGLAAVATLTSPVAGLFLALACGGALLGGWWLERRVSLARAELAVGLAALVPIATLVVLFSEGGYEPFAAGAFWPQLSATGAVLAGLGLGGFKRRPLAALRFATALYLLLLIGAFVIPSPLGSNALRLGALVGPPLAAGGLAASGRWRTLALLAVPLLYWQCASAINDQLALAGNPATASSFYAPLRAELLKLAGSRPLRVEVAMTKSHLEATAIPGGPLLLARGWDRQADTRFDRLFYRPTLTAATYRGWLLENGISYVALARAPLDTSSRAEARLIKSNPPFLRLAWRSPGWTLYRVVNPTPALATPPATVTSVGDESVTLTVPAPGFYRLAFHYTPYWRIATGAGCLRQLPGGWLGLRARQPGQFELAVGFSLAGLVGDSHCAAGWPAQLPGGLR